MWKLAYESLGGQMRSIWTVLLSVVVWIGRLAQHATKAALIFLISVAMWLPMCLTANTAVAAESDTAETVAGSGNSGKKAGSGNAAGKAGDKAKSANKSNAAGNPNAAGADTANISAPSQPPVFVDGQDNAFSKLQNGVNNNLSSRAAKGDASVKGLIDSAMMSAAKGMSSQSGADGAFVNTDRASNTDRSSNGNRDSNRNSKMEFRPGCYKEYARSECITDDGDQMGHRASNGADMERKPNPWSTVYSNFASPQGRYTENDPNFTPYPRGTYLQKRLRNLPYDAGRNGVDPLAFNQLDDVHDYIFIKRTPKRDGKGYIWDVLVNMGARIHGAANALTYFVVPKDQKLDASNGQYDQYVERMHFDANKRTCSKDWVNPNGFCLDKGVQRIPLNNTETLDKAWYRLKNEGVISDAAVYNGGTQSKNENKNRGLGLCHTGYGFDCYHSTNYGFPSDGEHLTGTRLPPDGRQRFNQTYIDLIDHLYLEMRGPDSPEKSKIFTLTNKIEDNKTSPYSYHIHYTTSDNGKYGSLSTSYYGAGTYYGDKWSSPTTRYGRSDPYGRAKPYSLFQWRGGKGHTDYEYTTLYQQWYGIPNLVDMRVPHFQFLRGTHLGPLTSNNGQLLAHTNNIGVTSLLFYPSQQRVCDKADESQCTGQVWAKGQISLSPKYNSADNKYARGNRWWRIPLDPNTNINTQDSSFGSHQMTVKYWNDKLQMGSSMPFKYDIIGQADVFRPLQTEEWNDKAKYRSPKTSLGKAENYVKYLDSKLGIYDFAIALNPRIYIPDAHTQKNIENYANYADGVDSVYYGSIKDGKIPGDNHGLEYPLNDSYGEGGSGASNAIKDRAIYSVEWTDKTGNDKKSDTLQDAETKVAVKVPVVNVVDPCKGDDDKAADKSAEKNKDGQECQSRPLNDTKRFIWKLYDAPKGKSVDQALTDSEKAHYANLAKADFSKPVKEEYATPTNPHNDNRIMMQSGMQPEVKPVYVLAKYAKITYWDESKDVLPLVFTHVDAEKPTIDVKVSVDGGEPQSVPEGGLNVSVGSRVRFLVTGHDDMHVHMGTKENVPNTNSTDVLEASKKWSGSFSKYDQSKQACGKTACADTLKDQSGYVTINDPNGSPAGRNDVPSKEFTFHAWDDAGNNVQKTVKLNIIDGNFIVPNVRWQKQNDGKYVGKVTLSKSATSVKMLAVRIWGRGKTKPFEEKDGTTTNIINTCNARSDGCQGIMLNRENANSKWVNFINENNKQYFTKLPQGTGIDFKENNGSLEITIPENLAEIGSRIYVDISTGKDPRRITQDKTSSDPLPLDITFPNGMVQVNPYELNPSERHALSERIRANNERIKWRGDEIGFVNDGKNNGYKDGKNDPQGKYSCDVEKDKQYKICLSLNPVQENTANGKRSTEKTLSVIKKTGIGNDNKDDQKQETVLDPTQKKITRFVDIRKDYDWSWNTGNTAHKNNLKDRDKDGGFKRYGADGAQFLVYEYDINDKDFNTEDLLKALQGRVKKNVEGGRENQPSLYPMNTGEPGSITKGEIENSWNSGWNGLPARRNSNNKDQAYARCLLAKGNKCSSSNPSNRGEWVNIFDVVEVGGLGGKINISNTGITDKSHVVQSQGYLMPGGSESKFNKQESGHKFASVILNKTITTTDKFATDLQRVQMYIFNGRPWEDLAVRGEGHTYDGYSAHGNGRQLDTPNTINVWFVPVDKNRPWIERKNANSKILSGCLKDKNHPTQCDSNIESLDLNKADFLKNPALFNIVDQLKLDDDFNKSADGGDSNKALKSRLWVDIVAEGVKDPKTGKAPRIRFVNGGVANNKLLKSFIYKWKGNDSNSATTFKLIAQTADDSGNKSGDEKSYETVVGMFKGKWQDATSPTVVAYDGSNAQKASTEATWLHTMKDAVKKSKDYHNGVLVRNSSNATRTAIYYTTKPKQAKPKADKLNASKLQSADSEALESAASDPSTNSESYWNVLAICKKDDSWSVCEGYKPVDGSNIKLDSKNGNVTFAQGFLAPGSVVRARSRIGIGPWTKMPGVKEQDVSSENYSHDSSTSNSADSLLNEKSEDVDDVILMDYASETPNTVCRADTIAAKTWLDGDPHTSDCVFFPVNVSEKVVQVHPLLLTKSEKSAVDYVLRRDNAVNSVDDSSWSENLDDDSSNDTNKDHYSTGENKSIVTWVRLQYASSSKPEDKRPDYKAGDKQDSFILTRGWRSREVTPTPRYNHITRFATLRSVGKDAADSADYKITWDKDKPYIDGRSDDPGFELVGKPGHQSLVYRYNASTKGSQINLNQLQNALTLKPNIPNGMSEDEFKKIQPSLRVVSGADKENGEKSKQITVPLDDNKTRTDQFGNGSGFFTLNGEYINIPDLVLGNGNYGGGSGVNVSGTEGMDHTTLGNNYSSMSPSDIDIQKWCEDSDTANPNCKTVNSDSFKLTKVLGGNKNIETADDVAGTSKKAIAPVYALSLSNGWAMNSLKNTYGYDAQTHFKNVASAPSLIPVYVVPVDVIKPKAESIGSLQKSTMSKPYEVTANDIKFTFTGNPDSKGKVSGKELFVNASDDFDSKDVVEKNLQVCVRWMNNNIPQQDDCTPILKRDNSGNASVDAEALQQMLVTHGNTAVYAVYAQTKDQSENESEHYGAGKDDKKAIIGYIKITGINVSPIPLPFTGGNAAITYTFLFGILMALFIASGAFGRRGWLASVLSGNGISGELTYSKHCNASAESLRCSRLFGIIYKNRH